MTLECPAVWRPPVDRSFNYTKLSFFEKEENIQRGEYFFKHSACVTVMTEGTYCRGGVGQVWVGFMSTSCQVYLSPDARHGTIADLEDIQLMVLTLRKRRESV